MRYFGRKEGGYDDGFCMAHEDWELYIRHPLRYGVRMITARVWESVGKYGPKPQLSNLRVVQDAGRPNINEARSSVYD